MTPFQTLTVEYLGEDCDRFAVKFPRNLRFMTWLKRSPTIFKYRSWNPNRNRWEIDLRKLTLVVKMGRHYFHYVDYQSLPGNLQAKLARALELEQELQLGSRTKPTTPHQTLFVAHDAPWIVVKAAYKALVALHHPDHKGDPAKFRAVQEAFVELRRLYPNET